MHTRQNDSAAFPLHNDNLIVEGHRDCYEQIHWTNLGEDNPLRDRLLPRLHTGGVDLVIYAIGGDTLAHSAGRDKKLLATIENISDFTTYSAAPDTRAQAIHSASDIPPAPDGVTRFLLHLEGGTPLEGSFAALEALFQLGVRSIQPTWNIRNELGDGVHERDTGSGLTRFGSQVLRNASELGMLIDLAHIAESGFWHAMRVADGPVVVTHANAKAVHDHPRNLSDDQIRALADSGGLVGVHTLPNFVGPDPTIDALVDHVLHIAEVGGIDHVAFGGDFVSCDGPRPGREALFHDPREEPPVLAGLEEAHHLANLTERMLARGLTPANTAAVLGGNLSRVLRGVLPK